MISVNDIDVGHITEAVGVRVPDTAALGPIEEAPSAAARG